MRESLVGVRAELDELKDRLTRLEHQLRSLEAISSPLAASALPPPLPVPAARVAPRPDSGLTLSRLGRTLVVLGGAYLLRSLTDLESATRFVGVLLGLLYGYLWLGLALRSGKSDTESRVFHGVTGLVIVCPILFEASTRLVVLPSAVALALLALTIAVGATVAERLSALIVAVAAILAGVATLLAMMLGGAGIGLPFALLLVLGAATVARWGDRDGWHWLCWLVAIPSDVAAVSLVPLILNHRLATGPLPAVALLLAFAVVYLGAALLRTLRGAREPRLFDWSQGLVALLIGFGGAAFVVSGSSAVGVGILGLVASAGVYRVAFRFADRSLARRRSFHFAATAALGLGVIGLIVLPSVAVITVAAAALAAALSTLAARWHRVTLSLHGVVFLLLAAAHSGLLVAAAYALGAPAGMAWPGVPPLAAVVFVAAAITAMSTLRLDGPDLRGVVARVVALVVFALVAAGVTITLAVVPLAGRPGAGADPAIVAALRTVVLCAAAVVVAALARWRRLGDLRWIVYGILVLVGWKLVLDDLRGGRSATLFVAFAASGAALVAASRLLRWPRQAGPPATSSAGRTPS